MMRSTEVGSVANVRRALLVLFAMGGLVSFGLPAAGQDVGYRDFGFVNGSSSPSGEKPESKLWFNDGSWWGSMWNDVVQDCHLYRLDLPNQTWIDTDTALDTRNSKADVLWDDAAQKLYVASHVFSEAGQPNGTSGGKVFRYSYSGGNYLLDGSVTINGAKTETLTLAKDSAGRLWATWVDTASTDTSTSPPPGPFRVMINHSTTDDLTWGTPYALNLANSTAVNPDDISAIIAFDGKVGVMWSNQNTATTYFAVHKNGDPDTSWTEEVVVPGSGCSGACSDDLLNLKADQGGRVFASIKTSLGDTAGNGLSPLIMLVIRDVAGNWSGHTFGLVQDHHTRPILQLDEPNQEVYLFATHAEEGGAIYYKSTSMNNPQFETGLGTPFIQSATDININNATSSKQNPTSESGIVVLASDKDKRVYWHNYLALEEPQAPPPVITSFSPVKGPAGTAVTINGSNFTGSTQVAFNGAAATFTVVSNIQIKTTVPAAATTGKISVTNAGVTGFSSTDFTVGPVKVTSFSPSSGPAGTVVTILGSHFTGATKVTFANKVAFFTVDSDTKITATVPVTSSGKIAVTTAAGTGSSSTNFTFIKAPIISSISPTSGAIGITVVIKGSNFMGTTQVAFNGTPSTSVVIRSASEIRAVVPLGATTGKISVTTPGGTVVSAATFTVSP